MQIEITKTILSIPLPANLDMVADQLAAMKNHQQCSPYYLIVKNGALCIVNKLSEEVEEMPTFSSPPDPEPELNTELPCRLVGTPKNQWIFSNKETGGWIFVYPACDDVKVVAHSRVWRRAKLQVVQKGVVYTALLDDQYIEYTS